MKYFITILLFSICSNIYGQKAVGMFFDWNKSTVPKVVPLQGLYMRFDRTYVSTSVTIPANSSVILLKISSPPLAIKIKSYDISTGTNTTNLKLVYYDDKTGIEKTVTNKYKFR